MKSLETWPERAFESSFPLVVHLLLLPLRGKSTCTPSSLLEGFDLIRPRALDLRLHLFQTRL